MSTPRFDIVIVGSGFAGASTAYHLSRRVSGSIAILEREKTPGEHASGRNASLFRQSETDPAVRTAAVASRGAYARHAAEIGYEPVGSILLGGRETLEPARVTGSPAGGGGGSRFVAPGRVTERIPLLGGHSIEAALETPGDGVIDTWALLTFYLAGARERGVELFTECPVLDVQRSGGSGPWRLETPRGSVEAGRLVNAAGGWAGELAERAGVPGPELVPYKRHLFVLDHPGPIDPAWPFVWDLDHGFYLRPESGGLLVSICDEERSRSLEETVSPGIEEALAERVHAHLPGLREAEIRRVWSCFRTRPADGRFVIGPAAGDGARAEGFFWVAGLGGHGMGCSWEVGRLAAQGLLQGAGSGPFDPARF
ncbi:MAG: FAD-dependent oxidoreductase [Acidobacteriota bacterium]|jgi:D-arginine dehydrogenase